MSTKITLHRPGQIGGCVTEIFTGRARILIDYGEELPGSPNTEPFRFPWKQGEGDAAVPEGQKSGKAAEARRVDAVFFTHYHGDHIGRLGDIPAHVPIYMSPLAQEVLKNIHTTLRDAAQRRARWDKGQEAAEWLEREEHILQTLKRARLFEPEPGGGHRMRPVGVGPIRPGTAGTGEPLQEIMLTPCRVDHSAAEACMFLIDTPDKRILHTGDFRGHGYGAGAEGAAVLEDVEQLAQEKKVDTLIIEGTMMSRQGEQPYSEANLRRAADELFARHRKVFLILSSTNFDSIRTFYEAARAKQIPFYSGSSYIASQLDTLSRHARIPQLTEAGVANPKDAAQMIRMRQEGFVVVIKGSIKSSGGLVTALKGCAPVIVYSMWMGYLTRGLDEELCKFIRFCQARGLEVIPPPDGSPGSWKPMHTSGHASPGLLAGVIRAADPGEIWPIHTENAAGFMQLDLPPALKERIRLGGYRKEKDHRALSEPALTKLLPCGKLTLCSGKMKPCGGKLKLCHFVRLVKEHPELALCLRGNSGNEAVIYYKNHAAFIISSQGHVRFNLDHARFLEDAGWQKARQELALAGRGYSFDDKPETKPKEGGAGLVSMPPERAAELDKDDLEKLAGCIERIIDSFFEGEKRKGKPLVEKEVQQKLFLACKAQKSGYFFYDMEFAQPWGKLLGCKNQPDMLAVRFGPDGRPERLVFVEVKSTAGALKGGSGLAAHIRGMENYPDWLLPVRGLDACRILEQYIALGMAKGPGGRYEKQKADFEKLGKEVLLVFTGADTLAQLDRMIKAEPTLLRGYTEVTEKLAAAKAALARLENPAELRAYSKVVCRKAP